MELKSHLPINWETGMMINTNHLTGLNQNIAGSILNLTTRTINPVNFGLFPGYYLKGKSLVLKKETPKQYFRIELVQCIALMPNGMIVNINPELLEESKINPSDLSIEIAVSSQESENFLLVYLEVGNDWKPVGIPDASENYDRKPFLNFSVKLRSTTLGTTQEITDRYASNPNVLPLILYNIADSSNPSEIKQFIPPCISFNSYQALSDLFDGLRNKVDILLSNCREVLKFVHEDTQKKLRSVVAIDMEVMLPPIINALISVNSKFKGSLVYQTPIALVELFKELAIAIRVGFFALNQSRRRELARYFSEFYGSPADFIEIAGAVESIQYAHINMFHSSFERILKFLRIYNSLFEEMAKQGLKTEVFSGGTYEEDALPTEVNESVTQRKVSEDDQWDELLG